MARSLPLGASMITQVVAVASVVALATEVDVLVSGICFDEPFNILVDTWPVDTLSWSLLAL